ncbi:MAG: hypothetical protein Q8K69_01255 [Bacteroidota bacterium]|nr:hypothetical protein [Bacteroidota bacterium]MDP3444757.1 hypothetical protein [Ignavibacteria bacterium]
MFKKLKILAMVLSVVALISSGNSSKSATSNALLNFSSQQDYSADAYIAGGNGWIKGFITYNKTQQGYVPIRYYFQNVGGRELKGNFYKGDSFTPLNPNNQYAKQYNFTHTIKVPAATVYLTLN